MRRLLVCDLDGTLLGERASLNRILELLRLPGAPVLAFATGRQQPSADGVLREWGVVSGAYLLAGVGTEAYARELEGAWSKLAGWPPPRERWDVALVRRALEGVPLLVRQRLSSQHKVSYVAPRETLDTVRARLREAGLAATIVHSHGDLLDVLPDGVDKGHAVAWLAARLGVPLTQTMTCGDTENDRAMLALPGPSVIVGGAEPELLSRLPELPRTYAAREPHAGGILEGLRQAGWLTGEAWSP